MMHRILCIVVSLLVFPSIAQAGHSRHSYVDGGQSMDGRFVALPKLIMGETPKKGPTPYHWEFEWKDSKTGETYSGKLEGLRSGSSNVFDPVGTHLFVAPNGETFAMWTPQVTMQSPTKSPIGERDSESFQNFTGFSKRLVIYFKTGKILKEYAINDFLSDEDWKWFHYYQRQTYWLLDYPGLHSRSAPRPFYSLYRISPDYTVLEFQIGANSEATHKAKQLGITPPPPRTVRINLTNGEILNPKAKLSTDQTPVQPFIGKLADKTFQQRNYVASLDPLRMEGKYLVEE
jgi:hypothetical protein